MTTEDELAKLSISPLSILWYHHLSRFVLLVSFRSEVAAISVASSSVGILVLEVLEYDGGSDSASSAEFSESLFVKPTRVSDCVRADLKFNINLGRSLRNCSSRNFRSSSLTSCRCIAISACFWKIPTSCLLSSFPWCKLLRSAPLQPKQPTAMWGTFASRLSALTLAV